ncbi:tyrosine-type recombinase/integrase [Archangium violaceum]|uniref:tyrosine-type recombinase/integrase n=1 Tax=Archangium violaceum TaxID=83451 RepID=UPI0037BF3C27
MSTLHLTGATRWTCRRAPAGTSRSWCASRGWAAWSHTGARPRGSRACWCVRRPRAASPCVPPCPPRCWRPGSGCWSGASFSFEKYTLAIKGACTAAGIPPFTPGRFRHSVATWAIEKGAAPASVAAFLNHKSPATTRRFYATHAVPAKIPTLR